MVRRLLQLSLTQINWFDVSANAVLKTHRTQFINHANYKIIDSNVIDCANVTKIPIDSAICQTVIYPPPPPPPPDEHALYKDNFATGNGELSKVIAGIAESDGNVFFVFHEH